MAAKMTETIWREDEFGVLTWAGYMLDDRYVPSGHEPFARLLDGADASSSLPDGVRDAAVHVHDQLQIARSIAVSMFGKQWREHVMAVYDRMQDRLATQSTAERDRASQVWSPPTRRAEESPRGTLVGQPPGTENGRS